MRHGACRVGDVEIVPLCDVVTSTASATESFPNASDGALREARDRYPWSFDGEGWRLHVHAFVLRTERRTILVDTGVGPESAPAFAWTEQRGALDRELAEAQVAPTDVDTVVITHVHDDHIGWNVAEGTADPWFANARYLIHRADWDWIASSESDEDRAIHDAVLRPLERTGLVDVTDEPVELTGDLMVEHAPGHTPGHQVVLVDSRGERGILAGDIANHPVMLLSPGVNGDTDNDPELAATTRAALVERIAAEQRLVASPHFAEPFGRLVSEGSRHLWVPEPELG